MLEGSLCEGEANTENQNRKVGVGIPVRERQIQEDQSFKMNPSSTVSLWPTLATQDPVPEKKIKTDRAVQPFSPCQHPGLMKEMHKLGFYDQGNLHKGKMECGHGEHWDQSN